MFAFNSRSLSPRSTCSHTPAFVRHSPLSLSLFIAVSVVFSQRALARSIYRLRGIISRHCARNTHTHSKVRVTATPAAPARSAIELMMLGPRRFNNKPHYLQSALGSITTGCPPHLVVVLFSSRSYTHSQLLSPSPSFSVSSCSRRRAAGCSYISAGGLHYFTANAQGAILNLYNQSAPTRPTNVFMRAGIYSFVSTG